MNFTNALSFVFKRHAYVYLNASSMKVIKYLFPRLDKVSVISKVSECTRPYFTYDISTFLNGILVI